MKRTRIILIAAATAAIVVYLTGCAVVRALVTPDENIFNEALAIAQAAASDDSTGGVHANRQNINFAEAQAVKDLCAEYPNVDPSVIEQKVSAAFSRQFKNH